jgi:hypothetical protein
MAKVKLKKKMGGAKTPHYPKGTLPGKSAVGHHAFKSQAQWRLFFANPRLRKWAIGKAHATGGHSEITKVLGYSPAYRRLPKRKGSTYHGVPLR